MHLAIGNWQLAVGLTGVAPHLTDGPPKFTTVAG